MIESGIKFETALPEVKINSQRNENGTMSITAGYNAYDIRNYVDMIAKELYDKFDSDLLDKLMEMNGCVKERTCYDISKPPADGGFWPSPHFKCSLCDKEHISMDYVFFCPNCGAKVIGD